MSDAIYNITVLVVAALAVVKGFRRGFTGQVSGILGLAFGAVCAHVFEDSAEEAVRSLLPGIRHVAGSAFIYSVLGTGCVYLAVYFAFRALTGVLRSAMQVFCVGMLDSLLGAAFCLVKYLVILSLAFNLILCVDPQSRLLRYADADDGNIVQCVLLLAPGVLGCRSVEDLSHILQLREAKKISHNITPRGDVITMPGGHCAGRNNDRKCLKYPTSTPA